MGQLGGKLERRDGIPDHHPTREKAKGPTEQFPFENLPENVQDDIIQEVLGRLPPKDRLRLSLVGKAWRKAARGSIKQIYMRDFTTELRRDGPLSWAPSNWLHFGNPASTKNQKAMEEFFNLLSGLSKKLDTLAIPWLVLAYGFSLNRWATLPVMGNVKTIIMCVKREEMTRIQDVLQKFPAADSLVLYYRKRQLDSETPAPFPTDFPTSWRKLTIYDDYNRIRTSGLYDCLARQANLTWLDIRYIYLDGFPPQLSILSTLHGLRDSLTTLKLGMSEIDSGLDEVLKQMVNLVFLQLQSTPMNKAKGDELLNSVKMLSNLKALHLKDFSCSSDALQELFREPQMQLKRAVLTECVSVDHLAIDALLTCNPQLEGVSLDVQAYTGRRLYGASDDRSYYFEGIDTSTDDWRFAFRNLGLLKNLKIFRVLVDLDPDLGVQKEPLPSDFVTRLRASDHPALKYAGIVQWDWSDNLRDIEAWGLRDMEAPTTTAMVRTGDHLHQADWVILPEPEHLVRDGIRAEVGNQEVTIPLERADAYCFKYFFVGNEEMRPVEDQESGNFCEELLI